MLFDRVAIEQFYRIFTYISQNRDETMGQARLVSRTASTTEARACNDLLKQAQTYLQRAKVVMKLDSHK